MKKQTRLRPSVPAEAKTALRLIEGDHTSTLRCVDCFQHGYNLIHLWTLVGVSIPASLHYICKRARATPRNLWPQILQLEKSSFHLQLVLKLGALSIQELDIIGMTMNWTKFIHNFRWLKICDVSFRPTCRTTADVTSEKLRSGYGISQQYISHKQMPKL